MIAPLPLFGQSQPIQVIKNQSTVTNDKETQDGSLKNKSADTDNIANFKYGKRNQREK